MKKAILASFFTFVLIFSATKSFGQHEPDLNVRGLRVLTGVTVTDDQNNPISESTPAEANANVRIWLDWMLDAT